MAKKANKFYVIGGQYQSYFYGATPTLLGAKRLANRNLEYWDNWQGWHRPNIYRAEDVEPCTNFYGYGYCPRPFAEPVEWPRKEEEYFTGGIL